MAWEKCGKTHDPRLNREVAIKVSAKQFSERFERKEIAASLWFRSVGGALNTIDGYESMHIIRKGQISWLAKGDVVGQLRFIHQIYGIAA